MKSLSKWFPITLCIFFTGILCTACSSSFSASTESNSQNILTLDSEDNVDTIYTPAYQSDISDQIEEEKSKKQYTLDSPLLIANPYGTNTTSLYLFFTTDSETELSYTISADGYEDFTRTVSGGFTTEHEHQLIGIIPEQTNTISLTVADESGNAAGSYTFQYAAPPLLGDADNVQLEVTTGESTQPLSDGLYTMLGNRAKEYNEEIDFILLYDNNGTLRSEIPIKSYRSCRLLFDNNTMYYSDSTGEIAGLDSSGRITHFYDMKDYSLHHDYIFGSNNDFLVLATDTSSNTVEDRIVSINRETGEITELIDLADLFQNYFLTLDHDEDEFDWMHINSLFLVGEDTLIISSRETSSIIKINEIYTNPTVDYIIGSDLFWEGTGYESLLLEQSGDFLLQAGQHCVDYVASSGLEEGQYYLTMYNNNNATISTRDYDYETDENYDGTYSGTDGEESYYYQYLIDEAAGTFELKDKIAVTYSGYVSSVQQVGDNLIIDSGSVFETGEFDKDHQLIQTLTGSGETWWYRVFKYDYTGYWFS